MPKISVIVPVYKVENYLRKCLDSLLAQTFQDFEILVIDDGSPDQSGAICDEYASKDVRVKVFHLENHGVSYARNFGIEKASGRWICFVDSDDWAESTMLEEASLVAEKTDADLIMWNYYEERPDTQHVAYAVSQPVHELTEQELFDFRMNSLGNNPAKENEFDWSGGNVPWCRLYRTEIFIKNNVRFVLNVHPYEDIYLNYIFMEYVNKAVFINKHLFHYRYVDTSSTHQWKEEGKMFQNFKIALSGIEAFNEEHPSKDPYRFKQAIYSSWIGGFAATLTRCFTHKKSPYSFHQTLKRMKSQLNVPEFYEAFHNVDVHTLRKKRKFIAVFGKFQWTLLLYLLGRLKNVSQ